MSNLSDNYEPIRRPISDVIAACKRAKEVELQRQAAPAVHAASLAVEMFGEDELERWASSNDINGGSFDLQEQNGGNILGYAEQVQQAHGKADNSPLPVAPARSTGSVPCDGWDDPFRFVPVPTHGYRKPHLDQREITEVDVDCSCCGGTGHYSSRYGYTGPCRLCNATGLVTVRGYKKQRLVLRCVP